ncbi:hypothetical protein HK098_004624 [Nowakowskiella sp. JEL0407]|nr:hypothetical protein HK098_004624 [Nowakowskiella sp. JEL0407]
MELLLQYGADIDAQDRSGRTPLFITVEDGNFEATKFLISKNARVYKICYNDETLLGCTVVKGRPEILRLVIERMSKDGTYVPNARHFMNGLNSIHFAPNGETAKVLIETGSDVNTIRIFQTPLICAIKSQRYDVVQVLLDNGADVNRLGDRKWNPLVCAIRVGDYDFVKLLLDHGADVDDTKVGVNYLALSCSQSNSEQIVELLIKFKANPDFTTFLKLLTAKTDDRSERFLQIFRDSPASVKRIAWKLAVDFVNEKICFEILKRFIGFRTGWRAETSESDGDIQTWIPRKPIERIERAVWNRHHTIIFKWIMGFEDGPFFFLPTEVLLQIQSFVMFMFDIAGVTAENVNEPNITGDLPLNLTVTNNGPIEKRLRDVATLLNLGADILLRDENGRLPAQIAWDHGNREVFRAILFHANEHQLLSNIQNQLNLSEIHIAIIFGNFERLKELLQSTMPDEVDVRDISNSTPLHHAASVGDIPMIQLLLDFGADINALEESGRTPLFITVGEGHFEAVKFLASNGADIYGAELDACKIIGCAAVNGHAEILRFLIDKMMADGKYDPDAVQFSVGVNAIHHALNPETAKVLIETGSDVNMIRNGKTPLVSLTERQNVETVKFLLENGADVNRVKNQMSSPLYSALRLGNYEMSKLLLEYGAEVDNPRSKLLTLTLYTGKRMNEKTGTSLQRFVDLLLSFNVEPDFSTFATLQHHEPHDRMEIFLKLFKHSDNQLKYEAWELAIYNEDEAICHEILKEIVGFRTGWTDSVEIETDETKLWKPRQPVAKIEYKVWRRHSRVIFRWITMMQSTISDIFPPEVLFCIENWL